MHRSAIRGFIGALLVCGCSRGDPAENRKYFPTVTGMTWVYQDDRGNDATYVVEGTKTVGSIECIVFKLDRLKSDQFDSKGRPESSREFCVVTDGGVSPYLRDRIYKEARPL